MNIQTSKYASCNVSLHACIVQGICDLISLSLAKNKYFNKVLSPMS